MGSSAPPPVAYGFVALREAVTLGCTFFTFAGPPLRSAILKNAFTGRLRSQVSAGFAEKDRGSPWTRARKPGGQRRFILAGELSFDLQFSALLRVLPRRGMRLRHMRGHMRDPAHGGANSPLDPDYPPRRSAGPTSFPPLEARESDPFRCVELGLGVFAGRKRPSLKVSPGRCGKRFQSGT